MSIVLVTGGSGFVGIHVVLQLLAAGHQVRTTVRRPDRQADVLAMLRKGGAASPTSLSFFTADLTADDGWREAVDGCDYVLHVASPLSTSVPKDENEMIIPARDGTLRVLRAAREAGVRRVVITSSLGAIGYGHPAREAGRSTRPTGPISMAPMCSPTSVQDARLSGRLESPQGGARRHHPRCAPAGTMSDSDRISAMTRLGGENIGGHSRRRRRVSASIAGPGARWAVRRAA